MQTSGKIPPDVLDEIRHRVDIGSVVGEHVRLRAAGANLKGLCPFHDEKTPSFNVSPAKNIFHCFGCGVGGDVFSFLMKVSGRPFPEVVEETAAMAGVDLSAYRRQGGGPDRSALHEVLKLAQDLFRRELSRSSRAQGYAESRGLDRATIEAFGVGCAPAGWSTLLDSLTSRGFEPDLLAEAGLVRRRKEGNGFYDAFRDRLTFPIRDERGRVVAFGARRIGEGEGPKYINSPEGPTYSKGNLLYNADQAVPALKVDPQRVPVLCEGYMDVIALARADIPVAVANLGTALTKTQAGKLSRWSRKWVLAFDSDAAGTRAAVRAVQLLDPLGVEVRVLGLDGKDPDEVLEKSGPGALQRALDEAGPVDEFLFEAAARRHDLSEPAGRSDAFRELREVFQGLVNPVLKEAMIRRVSDGLTLGEGLVREAFGKNPGASAQATEALETRRRRPPRRVAAERAILREVLDDVSLWRQGPAQALTPSRAQDPWVRSALRHLEGLELDDGPCLESLLSSLSPEEDEDDERLASFLRSLALRDEARAEDPVTEVADLLVDIEDDEVKGRAALLKDEMRECGDRTRRAQLLREYQEVQQRLDQLRRDRNQGGRSRAS